MKKIDDKKKCPVVPRNNMTNWLVAMPWFDEFAH